MTTKPQTNLSRPILWPRRITYTSAQKESIMQNKPNFPRFCAKNSYWEENQTQFFTSFFLPILPVLSKAEGPVLSKAEGPVLSKAEGPVPAKLHPSRTQRCFPPPKSPFLSISYHFLHFFAFFCPLRRIFSWRIFSWRIFSGRIFSGRIFSVFFPNQRKWAHRSRISKSRDCSVMEISAESISRESKDLAVVVFDVGCCSNRKITCYRTQKGTFGGKDLVMCAASEYDRQ